MGELLRPAAPGTSQGEMDPVVGRSGPVEPLQTNLGVNALPARLVTGQLLEATVERVFGSAVLLDVNGRLLPARTEVPLEERQNVWLQVTEAGITRIRLKVVENPQIKSELSNNTLETPVTDALRQTLLAWGMEPDDLNQNIARALLMQARTLTPEDVRAVRISWQAEFSAALSEAPIGEVVIQPEAVNQPADGNSQASLTATMNAPDAAIQPENVEALVFLYTRHLPVGKESLALACHWLSEAPALAARLLDLQNTVQQTARQLSLPGQGTPTPELERLVQLLETAADLIANCRVSPDTPPAQVAQRLAGLITDLGTPLEVLLANQLSTVDQSLSPVPGGNAEGEVPLTAYDSASQHELTRTLAQIKGLIYDLTGRADLGLQTHQTLHALDQHVDEVFRDLGAIHLFNLGNAPDPTAGSYYLFPIPLHTQDGVQTAFLKVFKHPGRRTLDGRQLRLALLLDLPGLGEIVVDLSVLDRRINGQILSGRESTNSLVEAELEELRQSLGSCGFSVDSLTSALLPAAERRGLSGDIQASAKVAYPAQIDVVA